MFNEHILLIEDDKMMAQAMTLMVESWNMRIEWASSAEDGLDKLENTPFDLVLTDVSLPGKSGFDVLNSVTDKAPHIPVIMITAHGDVQGAVQAIKSGAFDYVLKPVEPDTFEITVRRALEHGRLRRENKYLRQEMGSFGAGSQRMVGRCPKMLEVYDRIERVAATDSTVLIMSETGTGKELVAQTIHYRGNRSEKPFIACNCAAFSANLLESELFGHEKGAFTGATAMRRGRFEEANGGTIFLDEIGETSRDFQAKLLRVLQEQEIERVGSSKKIKINARVIASTNRDLEKEVAEQRFREDLYYRLSVVPITLPPLRERSEDIMILAEHFAQSFSKEFDRPVPLFSQEAKDYLLRHDWPGNVRELKNAVERAIVLAQDDELKKTDLESRKAQAGTSSEKDDLSLAEYIDDATRQHVVHALDKTGWERKKAADLLGIDRVTLYRILRKLDISEDNKHMD